VTIDVRGVPQEASRGTPFVLFALWPHEHKQTVLHFAVQRNTEYDGSVRSKDPLILAVGPRRFRVNPVYSEHTRGGGRGANNVHKFERYLRHGDTHVATTFGPVVYGNQPCLLLREGEGTQGELLILRFMLAGKDNGLFLINIAPDLVAMGTFLNPDPTRIIAKRILLTGHPVKVHKKTATIRYMFFNPEDIAYFKPIQLSTKHGRTGHIKESLGTHGYFKAHFDGPINQMDTICMALYKRVYPRWSEIWREGNPAQAQQAQVVEDDAMEE
jgi:pre-rRNA-processing protein TSR1